MQLAHWWWIQLGFAVQRAEKFESMEKAREARGARRKLIRAAALNDEAYNFDGNLLGRVSFSH